MTGRVSVDHRARQRRPALLPRQPRDAETAATADYRDVVVVAGADPYAWEPYEDRSVVEVRPDELGGCR